MRAVVCEFGPIFSVDVILGSKYMNSMVIHVQQYQLNLYSNHTEPITKYFVPNLIDHKTQNRSGYLVY